MRGVAMLCVAIFMMVCTGLLRAQFSFPAMGGRSAGMGGCSTALMDVGSSVSNMAGIADLEHAGVGVSVQSVALLHQLTYGNFFVATPISSNGGIALSYNQFGSSSYQEDRMGLVYALELVKETLRVGVSLDYLHSVTEDTYYPDYEMLSFSVGALVNLSSCWTLGFRCSNPWTINLSQGVSAPSLYNLGVSCSIFEGLSGTVELEYCRRVRVRGGLEYGWDDTFFARMGWASNPELISFGFGYRRRYMLLDLAMQMQHYIGITPCISVTYLF